jgi:hypothetical protein
MAAADGGDGWREPGQIKQEIYFSIHLTYAI